MGIRAFFNAPSERRKLKKRRSRGLLKHGNSSSESVNSDLAYGTGFLKRPKRRGVRSREGKKIDREGYRGYGESSTRDYARESSTTTREYTRDRELPRHERRGTDAEILAVGAGLAKLARDQNKRDLKEAKNNGRGSAAFAVEPSTYRDNGATRGLGPSKTSHQSSAVDDDGWESASDAESESSVDSKLAFGEESTVGWFPWSGKERHKSQTRKSSVVDPRLFGRQNSLNGLLTEPVGFGEATWSSSSDFGQQRAPPGTFAGPAQVPYYGQQTPSQAPPTQVIVNTTQTGYYPQPISGPIAPPESVASSSRTPMQHVYPMPTDDPSRFDVARSTAVSGSEPYMSSRPRPLPIQQPQPITPVSQSVYEPAYTSRSDSSVIRRAHSPSGRGKSLAEAALMGVAGAAVGAAIISDRNDGRRDKRREDRDTSSRVSERKDDKDDRRREKRREKEKSKDSDDDKRRDKKREKRRDEDRDSGKDRERRREERRSERGDERHDSRRARSDVSTVSTVPVDPFQYQVDDDAFSTPIIPSTPKNGRVVAVPTVVTVEREPDFVRRQSSTTNDRHVVTKSEPLRDDRDVSERHQRRRDSRDRTFHNAEEIYQETEHSTAPIEAAAISAAIAAVTAEDRRESRSERRRDERRSGRRDYDDYDDASHKREVPRDSKETRDPIQEEADRAYREIIMARKIASQVIRSRSPSPDPSVVHKYDDDNQEEEVIRIVTPPGMEDHKKKGPYDAPDADFQLDYVLENPQDLRTFNIPIISHEAPYLKRDPDTSLPRPHLNLVRPTPTPSPMPEKQAARSEKKRSRSNSTKSSDRKAQDKPVSERDVVIDTRGNVATRSSTSSTPSSSSTPKGVTWGENETKHYTVESPSEHRDEFVSSADIRAQDKAAEKPKGLPKVGKRSGGWGAIVAGVTGASFATGSGSETSTSAKGKESDRPRDKDRSDAPYEYRGIVVEPESHPSGIEQRSPPSPGPKPASPRNSQVPGSFDDLDFAATVAAGLQDTGFDPNIVIDDPSFRRRESPPGSNKPSIYRTPFAETVSDLGAIPVNPTASDAQGFVIGEVPDTPKDFQSTSFDNDVPSTKLSKKEQKKREKAARMDSIDVFSTPLEEAVPYQIEEPPESYFETPKLSKKEQKKRDKAAQRSSQSEEATPVPETTLAGDIVEEPESYFEVPKKSKKKSKKGSSTFDYEVADDIARDDGKVSVSVDAFDDIQKDDDTWNDTKKSKKKSKRDSDRFDSPSRSVVSEATPELERSSSKKSKRDSGRFDSPARSVVSEPAPELERSSSKKSKDKSRRKFDQVEPEPNPADIALPSVTPSEISHDGDFDELRKSRKASKRHSGDRDESRSVVSESAYTYVDDEYKKSKKKSRSSIKDDFDDTRSVASAPAGDEEDRRNKKKEKRLSGGFFGLFGAKSESGARDESPKGVKDDFEDVKKKSKKSKRNSVPDGLSLYGDVGSQSVDDFSKFSSNGNGHSNGAHYDHEDEQSRPENQNGRSRAESTSSKKDSFLAKAGTLGAGVGLAGAAVAIVQHHQRSKADNADRKQLVEHTESSDSTRPLQHEIIDNEITKRDFRPSIDPQYGDLLPLPPSDPTSPNVEPNDNLPELPESRPDTPEAERMSRDRTKSVLRKTLQETPMKSPSQSAVPLKFIMGNRSNPVSPGLVRASPMQSPATPSQDSLAFPRNRSRPTSWDNTRDYKPLYLVESNRRASVVQPNEEEQAFPSLPPSEGTSGGSSQMDSDEFVSADEFAQEDSDTEQWQQPMQMLGPLTIDTSRNDQDLLGSQQSTPKAAVFSDAEELFPLPTQEMFSELQETPVLPTLPISKSPFDHLEERSKSPEHKGLALELLTGAALVSGAAYSISKANEASDKDLAQDELPSHISMPRSPSPVEPTSKDRSSYLLRSSPMPRNSEEADHELPSPVGSHAPTQSGNHSLDDIQERHGSDIFGQFATPATTTDNKEVYDTEKLPRNVINADSDHGVALAPFEEQVQSVNVATAEPIDDFTTTKSKKDKKLGKKKAKGLSRTSTMDDTSLVQPTQQAVSQSEQIHPESEPISTSVATTILPDENLGAPGPEQNIFSTATRDESNRGQLDKANPAEEFSSKSKSDTKEDKATSRSFTLDDVSLMEPSQEPITADSKITATEDPSTMVVGNETPLGEISTPPDEDQATPESFETPVGNDELVEEFPFIKSKKDKKKDKKKGKGNLGTSSMDDTAPEQSIQLQQNDDSLGSIEKAEEYPPPTPGEEFYTPSETLPADEFSFPSSSSKKSKKNKKNKSALSWDPEPVEDTTETLPASKEAIAEDVQTAVVDEDELVEQFSLPKSKKDKKKKGKSALSWDPEPVEDTAETLPASSEVIAEDVGADISEELVEPFFLPKSKKDKKKKKSKSAVSWDPEPVETPPEISQSSRELTDVETPLADDSVEPLPLTKSTKEKKKDKKNKSTTGWDEEPETSPQVTPDVTPFITDVTQSQDLTEPFEDFAPSKSKKDKKRDKKKGTVSLLEPEPVEVYAESSAQPLLDVRNEIKEEADISVDTAAPADEFPIVISKKDKKKDKKKGKLSAWDPIDDESTSQPDPEARDNQDVTTGPSNPDEAWQVDTKISKKKDKKSKSKTFDFEDENTKPLMDAVMEESVPFLDTPTEAKELEILDASASPKITEDTSIFDTLLSKHDQKPSSFSAWEEDVALPIEEVAIVTPTVEETFAPQSKKGKKAKKGKAWEPEEQIEIPELPPASENADDFEFSGSKKKGKKGKKSRESASLDEPISGIDHSSSKEVEQTETPVSKSIEDTSLDPEGGSFLLPSSKKNKKKSKKMQTWDPEISAEEIQAQLSGREEEPIVSGVVSEAPLSADRIEPLAVLPDLSASKSLETGEPQESHSSALDVSTPDGLEAGYNNEQLSLAKQLQLEFGKKSKKDNKKKRQSLPSTPDSEFPRSRIKDLAETHPRARSLSVEPFVAIDRQSTPTNEPAKSIYSEDQLELARQLKADFEGGNKKSMKDKKKRQSLIPEVTYDTAFEEPGTLESGVADFPTPDPVVDSAKGDGFAAGYQEDQLSLARQLQAEFGSGAAKKTKKDKKRRSTSQTPTQQPEVQDDYFGTSPLPVLESSTNEKTFSAPEEGTEEKDFPHDGLAAGYKEDQLELARQLKEEFSSGSKKSKKDKKRQSLSRGISDDYASPKESPLDVENDGIRNLEDGAEPEDEFAIVAKKSKKDKKGKKRESLVPTVDVAETLFASNLPGSSKTVDENLPIQSESVEEAIVPEEEFSLKKSKKDKKGKKGGSLTPTVRDMDTTSGSNVEDASQIEDMNVPIQSKGFEELAIAEEEFSFKKSKKDKKGKKRDSVLRTVTNKTDSPDNFGNEIETLGDTRNLDSPMEPINAKDIPANESTIPEVQAPLFEEPQLILGKDSVHDKEPPLTVASIPDPESISEPIDDWSLPSKKSKKDKKKRDTQPPTPSHETPTVQQPSINDFEKDQPTEEPVDKTTDMITPIGESQNDEFAFTTKKSKKEKKNRKSTQNVFDEEVSQIPATTNQLPETPVNEVVTPLEPEIGAQDDSFEFTTKKSKKDKKNRKTTQASFDEEESRIPESQIAESSIEQPKGVPTDEAAAPIIPETEAQIDDFAFSTKKSKKDKKNRKSLQSTMDIGSGFDDSSQIQPIEDIAIEPEIPAEAPDDTFEFTTKKSKKDKKNRKSLQATTPEEVTATIDNLSTDRSLLSSHTSVAEDILKAGNLVNVVPQTTDTVVQSLDLPTTDPPIQQDLLNQPATDIVDTPKDSFDEFSFASKKSKKSKRDRKDSSRSPNENSGVSTPTDPIPESISAAVDAVPLTEETPASSTARVEPTSLPFDAITNTETEQPDEEWGNFSTKKSKKDKKKLKSGLSTPLEPELVQEKVVAEAVDAPESIQASLPVETVEESLEQPEEEWGTFALKKSKKDKKKGKSGLSTPTEPAPIQAVPLSDLTPASDIQDPENEWGEPISSKKSKKDKKKAKSGLSTPLEVESRDELFVTENVATDNALESKAVEDVQQPEDEWSSTFSSKKSKKDKKKGKSNEVIVEESKEEMKVEDAPISAIVEPSLSLEEPEVKDSETQPEDDWTGTLTTKKSKRDKKNKSGISTPISAEDTAIVQENQSENDVAPASEVALEQEKCSELPEDEWGGFSMKKSKKDKKNRKSGVSTPVEDDKPIIAKSLEDTTQASTTPQPDEIPTEQIASLQPEEEGGSFSVKKSKKDKKNRKSATSTPTEEVTPLAEPLVTSGKALDEANLETPSVYEDAQSDQYSTPAIRGTFEDKSEGYFAPASKSTKKSKKNRKSGLSTPMEETYPVIASEQALESLDTHQDASLTSHPIVTSPISLPTDLPTETPQPEIAPISDVIVESATAPNVIDPDDFATTIGRKGSKKDKRKRQVTADTIIGDEPSSSRELPLTSWADEVEEAEVERSLPVIDEIANDESLSYIASTTEASSIDDFARPTKKGKKGKKRDSVGASSLRSPATVSIKKENAETPSKKPAIAVTAALIGAAVAATSMPTDKSSLPKKLSKKEQRKLSIDKRAPRDDVFDDPALWEGEEPMAFEESKGIDDDDDDVGSDGFWSAQHEETQHSLEEQTPRSISIVDDHPTLQESTIKQTSTPEDLQQQEKPEQYQPDSQNKIDESFISVPEILASNELTAPGQKEMGLDKPLNDVPDYTATSSKKDKKKKKKQNDLAAWEKTEQQDESRIVEPPVLPSSSEIPKTILNTTDHQSNLQEERADNRSFIQQPISSSRELRGQEQPLVSYDPLPETVTSTYARPKSRAGSVLPIVREESPEDPKRINRQHSPIHDSTDLNRDSAFITESPVPPQRGFTDKYEHIRDSGVHLRDDSPAAKSRAPVSATDDAIARLSWPAIDDESETVELYKPHMSMSNVDTKKKNNVDSHRSHQIYEERPQERTVTSEIHPALRPNKSVTSINYQHEKSPGTERRRSPLSAEARISHDDKTLSRDTINSYDKHYGGKNSIDLLPSQRAAKSDKPIDLHRTEIIHRSSKPESLVQQRVKRIESPDLPKPQKPREGKYTALGPSQRPNAEKPSSFNDTSLAAGAVLAGATLGFAAARKSSRELRPEIVGNNRSSSNINRLRTPDSYHRPDSAGSNRSTGTPPLRRSDRKSGDLRSLSQHSSSNLAKEAELAAITASTSTSNVNASITNPTANEGRVRAKDMADVYVS